MRIVLVTNMFPTKLRPGYGIFVKIISDSLMSDSAFDVELINLSGSGKIFKYLDFFYRIFVTLVSSKDIVVYTHTITHSAIPILAAQIINPSLRVISNIHGGDVLLEHVNSKYYKKILKLLGNAILRKSNLIVVPSKWMELALDTEVETLVSPSGGVPSDFFLVENRPKVFDYICVGRAEAGKGLERIISIAKDYPDCKFVILSEGTGLSSLVMRCLNLGNVKIIANPTREVIIEYLGLSKFMIFPTQLSESLGLVGLEAMAQKVPVIGNTDCGIGDYLQDSVNGFHADPCSMQSLRDAIEKSLQLTDAEYSMMSEQSHTTALRYSSTHVLESLKKHIKNV